MGSISDYASPAAHCRKDSACERILIAVLQVPKKKILKNSPTMKSEYSFGLAYFGCHFPLEQTSTCCEFLLV